MDVMLGLAASVVWLVFLVAGLRKLRQADATALTLRSFGMPTALAGGMALVLPWAELAVAVLLLMPVLATLGTALALLLLIGFSGAIVVALVRGMRPACNCFGQAPDKPISWWTAARNALMLALTLGLLTAPGRLDGGLVALWAAALSALDTPSIIAGVLATLLTVQTVVLIKLFSQQGRMLLRIDNLEHELAQRGRDSVAHTVPEASGPAMGALAPDFELRPLAGGTPQRLSERLTIRRELVLVFISPGCGPCHELLVWLLRQPQRTLAMVVTSGSPEYNRRLREGHDGLDIVIQSGQDAQDLYGVVGTPSAVRIVDGRIASPTAIGLAPIQSLFEPSATGDAPARIAGAPRLA